MAINIIDKPEALPPAYGSKIEASVRSIAGRNSQRRKSTGRLSHVCADHTFSNFTFFFIIVVSIV